MADNFEDYSDLQGTGFQGGGAAEQTPPEEEFFHSVYISAQPRKNHLNIVEESGKFQVRGVEYNLDEVHLVITHTKDILAKIETEKGRDSIKCFSFREGVAPWCGTTTLADGSLRPCPMTSAERAANDFCSACRMQVLVAGIYCNPEGAPILTDEKKPVFVFLRGKGMRFKNVSDYLNDLYNEELPPIFKPVTEQSKEFEKQVVNNKRFVTKVTRDVEKSSYGNMVNIFVLEKGPQIPDSAVLKILKLSKETVGQFNEKFDWSKSKKASGYGDDSPAPAQAEGVLPMDEPGEDAVKQPQTTEEKKDDGKTFSFDDIEF